jgi:hypothetical protein
LIHLAPDPSEKQKPSPNPFLHRLLRGGRLWIAVTGKGMAAISLLRKVAAQIAVAREKAWAAV